MAILVQEIVTTWTKESRSGEAARKRNHTPRVLPLPPAAAEGPLLHHRVDYDESRQFLPKDRGLSKLEAFTQGLERLNGLEIRPGENGAVQVKFVWNLHVGAPERPSQHLGKIAPGEWIQLVINGRHGERGEWRYQQTSFNIGHFNSSADFADLQLVATHDLRADLL